MQSNPVIKPRVATSALIVASAVMLVLAVVVVAIASAGPGNGWFFAGVAALGLFTLLYWALRFRKQRVWRNATDARWKQLENVKNSSGITTEITVLSVDALQPTGSWITIRWNRFDFTQPAWIEALPEPIWPGSILLISPDPDQVWPGSPWPATYLIRGSQILAWAPQL
jgi:hypothetical protein